MSQNMLKNVDVPKHVSQKNVRRQVARPGHTGRKALAEKKRLKNEEISKRQAKIR